MSRTTSVLRAVSLVLCVLFSTLMAHAQYRASIQGVVTDPQGAVVSGAKVTLRNLETGQLETTQSDGRGIFNFNGLPPSKFSVTVEKEGFKKKEIQSFGINAEQGNALNVQLDVGQATEQVTVNGDAVPLLDTETANLGGSVQAQQFQQLASFGRDPFQLLQLAPGAFGDGAQGAGGGTQNLPATTIGGTGGTDGVFKIENGGQITANGARTGENNYQIDGVGTTSVTWGGTSVITPNEDSVKEIKIVTDNYDAENGRYRGAQVQIISQNGTNNYHGSFFFKAHRPGLNAFTKYNGYNSDTLGCINNKANGYCGNVRDENRFNDWGGSVGGPIVRNHLFGFFSYETIANNAQAVAGSGWFETAAFRGLAAAGPNAAKYFAYPGVAPYGGTQVDRDCASAGLTDAAHVDSTHPVANCVAMPGQGLNIGTPLTAALGARDGSWGGCYHKDANGNCTEINYGTGGDGTGSSANLGNTADIAFIQGTREPSNSTHRQYNGRVDFQATSKDLIAFSFYYVPNSSSGINNGNIGDRSMNLFNSTYKNRAATLLWDHTLGATMENEARINAAGWLNKDLSQNPNAPWGLPILSFNGTASIKVSGYGIGSFNGFDQWTTAGKDVFTKVHGAHTMKMGGEFTHLKSVDAPFWADRPGYTFNNIWDFLNDAPVSENAQFDPQTGVPSAEIKNLRNNLIGLFFQDNYKVRPTLTVTAGLRWDYFGPIHERDGKLATVQFGSGANELSGLRVRTGGNQYTAQKANFGPQIGVAWSPRELVGHDFASKLVIRGGFGIAYNGISQSNTLDVRFNPPYVNNGTSLSGSQILYSNSFPSNVHSPNGYASNPYAKTSFDSNNLPLTGMIDLTALPATWPTEYALHYTLGAEYDLGHQWVASAGYQGSQTRNLLQHYNLYNPAAAAGLALNPAVHGVTIYNDNGTAHFNALLLEAKHAFSQSFQFDTQYRLSHAVDIGSNAYAGPYYQWNLGTAQGTADYDVRHAFKAYGVWAPRIFTGSRSWMEKIIGGWSLSGILNAHSGFPWTPVYGLGEVLPQCTVAGATGPCEPVFNFGPSAGGGSADAGAGNLQPAAYAGGFKSNYRSSATVSASSMFTPPTVVAGTYFQCLFPGPVTASCPNGGSQPYGPLPSRPGMARNAFTGPGYFDIDATISKSFGLPPMKVLGEGAKIEFRANFFNLFNKLNLYNPQTDIMNSNFGEAQNVLGARVIEMQARFSF